MNWISIVGPPEFLDIVYWTVNNKIAVTGKFYLGVFERLDRGLAVTGVTGNNVKPNSRNGVVFHVRDKVSLHDAVMLVDLALDQIADVNSMALLRGECQYSKSESLTG